MKRMLLIFSHSLTPEQKEDGEKNLSVKEFVSLSNDLQSLWSQIPTVAIRIIPEIGEGE